MDSPDSVRVTSSSGDHFTPSDKQKDESKRTARKIGEKLRRERLNGHLTQLSEQIPWIAESERRLDKVSILRLTVNYMKLHHGLKKRKLSGVWQPSVVDKQMIKGYFQEVPDGFVIVVSNSGTVIFVSQTINKYLGHDQVDVIGNSIYNIVHPDDHAILETQFSCKQGQESHVINQQKNYQSHSILPQINSAYNERRSFYIHMQNLTNGENENQYERVHVLGHMRFDSGHKQTQQKKHSGIDDTWLVASCRIEDKQPILEVSQFYANKNEFISQHAMDGKVLFTDQRVAVITGFMASDRVGESVYSLINPEDLDAVAVSHMKIMTDGEIPSTVFRMNTVTGSLIYIQSRSIIIKDAVTKVAKYIVSVNVCLGQQEGNNLLEEQRKRVKALVAATKGLSLNETSEKGDNSQKGDKNSDFKKSEINQMNKFSSKPCTSVSGVSKINFKDSCCTRQSIGGNRGIKRQFIEEESADSDKYQGNPGLSQKNGQSNSKGNSKASSLLKSLLLSDDTDKDMEILKEKSLILERNGCSQSFPDSFPIDNSSGEKNVSEEIISNGNSLSLLGQSSLNHVQSESPSSHSHLPSLTRSQTSFISNDIPSSTENFTPARAFQNSLPLPKNTFDHSFPKYQTNCQKDNVGKNSTCVSKNLTSHDNNGLFSQPEKQHSSFKNLHSSCNKTLHTSKPNSQWNLMDILQGHVNKSALFEAETTCMKERSPCCETSSFIGSNDLQIFETDYYTTNPHSSDLQNGSNTDVEKSDLSFCHWRDDPYVNQNGVGFQSDSENSTTQFQTRGENGEIISYPVIPTNGLLSGVEENYSSADTTSISRPKDLQGTDNKVKLLLAHQLHVKHNHIDNSLKNQTEQIKCMKIQMKMLQNLSNKSLQVTSFMEQLSDLQDEVSKQKKLLIDLKNETVLQDRTLKK